MVDAGDSKSPAARRAGSSPALGTNDLTQVIPHKTVKVTQVFMNWARVSHHSIRIEYGGSHPFSEIMMIGLMGLVPVSETHFVQNVA
jgi:hypothetical protein